MGKVQIQSRLRKIAEKVVHEKNLEKAKEILISFVKSTRIKELDKRRIEYQAVEIVKKDKLDMFVYNSILKYEGLGTIEGENQSLQLEGKRF